MIAVCGVVAVVSLKCLGLNARFLCHATHQRHTQNIHCIFIGTFFVSSMLTRDQNVEVKEETEM